MSDEAVGLIIALSITFPPLVYMLDYGD